MSFRTSSQFRFPVSKAVLKGPKRKGDKDVKTRLCSGVREGNNTTILRFSRHYPEMFCCYPRDSYRFIVSSIATFSHFASQQHSTFERQAGLEVNLREELSFIVGVWPKCDADATLDISGGSHGPNRQIVNPK